MDVRIARGPTRWGARTLVVGLTTSMLAIAFCNGKIDFGKLSSLGQITPSQALDAFISAECLRFDRLSCAAQ